MPKYINSNPSTVDNLVFNNATGRLHFIPAGSIGVSASATATASKYAISMSANTSNYHTPTDGTSSYLWFSASSATNGERSSIGLFWTATGSKQATRIIPSHNSSSANSGYGILGGTFFTFTASAHAPKKYYKLAYANPESRVAATSSAITFTSHPTASFSSSQGYIFQITGSNTNKIYNYTC